MSSTATAPGDAVPTAESAPSRPSPHGIGPDVVLGLVLGVGLAALAFTTSGGFNTPSADAGDTWSEIAIMALGAAAGVAAVVLGARGRAWGATTVALFAALTAYTALSIAWSVQPDDSWQSAGQTVAYLAAFAAAAALARLAPERWPALVGAVAVAAVALSAYGLLTKVFPAMLDAVDPYGRLQSPFSYWNAVGVTGALGLAPCLWAGARREGPRALRALAAPGVAVLIVAVVLSFSRSADLVAVLGVGCWLAVVPLRLRAVAVLALGGLGAAVIAGWALATTALTGDRIPLSARVAAGHTFGIVLLLTLLAVTAAGVVWASAVDRIALPEPTRRRIGKGLVVLVALIPVAGVVAATASSRGLTGQISHIWSTLTSTSGGPGDNSGRIFQFGNTRPLYWSEGLSVGEHSLLHGVGAEGFATARTSLTTSPEPVSHAHSYVIQTFADLGLIGIAINLALLAAWALAAARPLARRTAWRSLPPALAAERLGLITLAVVVLAFGVQSAVDWTWYFPAVAIPALLCAGWLAGRGPLASRAGRASPRRSLIQRPAAAALITALVTVALLGAWTTWQPLRSANALSASLQAISAGHTGQAFTEARDAADIDPVSIEPLQILASLYTAGKDPGAARAELAQATVRQPDNAQTWLWLGEFDLLHNAPRRALGLILHALRLDRTDQFTIQLLTQARNVLGIPLNQP